MQDLLREYNGLPESIRNNLHILDGFHACYEKDENISDDMATFITSMAYDCWLKDEYSKASVSNYAEYLLEAVYDYGATKEELDEISLRDIVEAFNLEDSPETLLEFDTSDLEYCFATVDRLRYYSDEDGLYVLNDKGRCLKKPHPSEDTMDEIFSLLAEDKIVYMPFSMHYNIRCMIKNDIMRDEELKEQYKDGIEKYKNICLNKNITSEDILKAVDLDNDISLTEIDGLYTKANKMERLSKYYHNIHEDGSNYTYVASFDNGTDYYYKKGKYLALDKNNVVKEFEDNDNFLISELKEKYKFLHITDDEIDRITNKIENDFEKENRDKQDNIFSRKNISALVTFVDYLESKDISPFKNKIIPSSIKIQQTLSEAFKEDLRAKIRMGRKQAKRYKEFEK